jgi:hypothetical protein
MFKALCGEDAFSNVAILTSMWLTDEPSVELDKQVAREGQLEEDYLTDILGMGGLLRRLKSKDRSSIDVISAKRIFQELFESWKDDQITLSIQHELINDFIPLNETAAGKVLSSHLDQTYEYYESEISKLRETINESKVGSQGSTPHQNEAATALLEQQTTFQQYLDQLRADQEAMKVSLLEIHAEEKDRLTAQLSAMESRWQRELASKEREQALREQVLSEMRDSMLQRDSTINQLREQQQRQEAARKQQVTAFAQEQETKRDWEAQYYAQLVQQGRWREERYEEELKRTRKEMEWMREDFRKRVETAGKAKRAWVGPLMEGMASGGLGLAGSLITAGELDFFNA